MRNVHFCWDWEASQVRGVNLEIFRSLPARSTLWCTARSWYRSLFQRPDWFCEELECQQVNDEVHKRLKRTLETRLSPIAVNVSTCKPLSRSIPATRSPWAPPPSTTDPWTAPSNRRASWTSGEKSLQIWKGPSMYGVWMSENLCKFSTPTCPPFTTI